MDDANSVTTKLLTLLNVSATKIGKRKRVEDFIHSETKLNKRARPSVIFEHSTVDTDTEKENRREGKRENINPAKEDDVAEDEEAEVDETEEPPASSTDGYEKHFGLHPLCLSESSRLAVDANCWTTSRERVGKLGSALLSIPQSSGSISLACTSSIEKSPFIITSRSKQDQAELREDLISTLSTRKDVYITSLPIETKIPMRETIALHALNHVARKRRRILKNNERLVKAAKTSPNDPPHEDVQDQGFTRPSVLIVLPFRSFALDWFRAITSHTSSASYQIENQARFLSEYSLPDGVTDKLLTAEPGTHPPDHVDMFKGNVDDNFRIGLKLTRKTVKMFSEFYGCDIILASPLGLRRSIEKEKHADYLTSIEVLVIDQMDALTMQNWEHVKFVLGHINNLPKELHDTDFSRIKPWYLDGLAAYLRQSILLSAYETPETRSLYNGLKNVAGKIRTIKLYNPIEVPAGMVQNFLLFDCTVAADEPERRFQYFTTQIIPAVLKSAVQSTNTIVFIPSSFDFIRIQNYFRRQAGVTFTILSEYSKNQDISRARLSFFNGSSSFLLISERFHFFRRYRIRGCRNLIFYGPPDHPQFYGEFLTFPFLDDGVESGDVTCRVLYSKYDKFRLERIVGSEGVGELIQAM